jgi:hypothetical protein
MVYVWGILTGILVSVLHTFALNRFSQGGLLVSLFLGGVIGAAGGTLTPTAFTGLLDPVTTGWGFFTGVVYAATSHGSFWAAAAPQANVARRAPACQR